MTRRVSLVVCTRDRPLAVADVLRDAVAQLGPGDEVVVVDQSGPEAAERVARAVATLGDPRVRRIVDPEVGLPAARNRGLAATTGEVVWFVDDDVRLRPGALEAHRAAYDDPSVGGVGGRIEERVVRPNAAPGTNRLGPGGRVRTNLDADVPGRLDTLKGANMSFRRDALAQAGPCDPGYGGNAFLEDADWSTRVAAHGWVLRYEPSAAVVHLSLPVGGCRLDPRQAERWRFRNTGRFVRRHRPGSAPRVFATFAGVALKRALAWRRLQAPSELLGAWVAGWSEAGDPAAGVGSA